MLKKVSTRIWNWNIYIDRISWVNVTDQNSSVKGQGCFCGSKEADITKKCVNCRNML